MKKTSFIFTVLLALPLLSACAGLSKVTPCPATGALRYATMLPVFQNMENIKPEQLTVLGQIGTYRGQCKFLPNGDMNFDLDVDFVAQRQALAGDLKSIKLPYFIAVLDADENVLNRVGFRVKLEFEEDGTAHTTETHHLTIAAGDAASARVALGYELTPEQLAYIKKTSVEKPADYKGR